MEFTRVDYTLFGLTSPNCMKLLPPSTPKTVQKVVAGDHDGIVQLFSLKKGEIQLGFKTLPGERIKSLQLGGALGTIKDKIFAASKNQVQGYTKKGKLFLGFETNLTESIKSMYVSGNDLLVTGTYVYNHYKDCKDANSYRCGDQINDVICLSAEKLHQMIPVLACEDRTLKVLDHSLLSTSFPTKSAPTVLHLYNNDGGITGHQLLYGMQDGSISMVQVTKSGVTQKWILENTKNRGSVQCLHCYDMTGDGVLDLLVGRHDGSLQVYTLPADDSEDSLPPAERFSYVCNESVTSIQGGMVGSSGFDEIVATTYTGWFFGLTTEIIEKQMSGDTGDLNSKVKISNEDKMKIVRLRAEIEEMENRVTKERESYQTSTQEDANGFSALPFLAVNDKIYLSKEEAVYHIMIEVETPIDNILIQSDVDIELLDVEKNSAVVSYSKCPPSSGNCLLATYRCQLNTTRLELKIRTKEGKLGTLQAYITPLMQPKCCQLRKYQIKPLSLHSRCHDIDISRSYNKLTLKGGFSLAEMHNWLASCLPEITEKPPAGEKISYNFMSVFLNTMLQCNYGKGEAEFKSDNISTISILKDILTKEATKKKIKVDLSCDINEESAASVIKILDPKLKSEVKLCKDIELLEGLREIETYESGSLKQCLTPEYKNLLNNEKALLMRFNKQSGYLNRLIDAVIELYLDWNKFKGINVKNKIPMLTESLKEYELSKVLSFFQT